MTISDNDIVCGECGSEVVWGHMDVTSIADTARVLIPYPERCSDTECVNHTDPSFQWTEPRQ